MNNVQVAYIVCSMITELALLGLAVAAPIWLTPGYYWWTGFFIILVISQSAAFTKRVNGFGTAGNV